LEAVVCFAEDARFCVAGFFVAVLFWEALSEAGDFLLVFDFAKSGASPDALDAALVRERGSEVFPFPLTVERGFFSVEAFLASGF
jgi:hypothetical protein